MKPFKVIVEKHPDGYIAYPLGLKGVVIGQGDTYEAALADVRSAINFHIETFGPELWRLPLQKCSDCLFCQAARGSCGFQ